MESSGEYSDTTIPTGGPVMKVRLAFALLPLLFLGSPVYAQSPCSECLKAAEKNLKNASIMPLAQMIRFLVRKIGKRE
jgi:hypothetical protein